MSKKSAEDSSLFIALSIEEINDCYGSPDSYEECLKSANEYFRDNPGDEGPLFIVKLVSTVKPTIAPLVVTPTVFSDYKV